MSTPATEFETERHPTAMEEPFPSIISVDDHILEPPRLWEEGLPARFRERGPRLVRERVTYESPDGAEKEDWGDVWYYEDARVPLRITHAATDTSPEEVDQRPIIYEEVRPGCFDPHERLKDMDLDGVEASLCFPNLFVRFCGQRFLGRQDTELALHCIRAYNDWLVDQWQAESSGRLAGAAIVPLWDANLAADEVRRVANRGVKAVCFSELPSRLGLPSMYSGMWEPFFAACNETRTLIGIHIGSSSTNVTSSDDAPTSVAIVNYYANSSLSLTDWIVSGVFARYPDIRILYSEGQAGWMPFLLGRLDVKWEAGYAYAEVASRLTERPSTYFKDHVYACVTEDPAAMMFLDAVGADNICFETDYPHPDSSWPHSMELAKRQFGSLPSDQLQKVVHDNGCRLLQYTPVHAK